MVKSSKSMDGGSRVLDLVQYCWENGVSGDSALDLICRQLDKENIAYNRSDVESKMYQCFDEIDDEDQSYDGW